MRDYFSGENSTYNETDVERRFRLPRNVFDTIYNRIFGKSLFVHQKTQQKNGIHPLCRFVACLRYLAYGVLFNYLDEYCRIPESSLHRSVKDLMIIIITEFGEEFLNRSPNDDECDFILQFNYSRGFPCMFASWDCTHYSWKKSPTDFRKLERNSTVCKLHLLLLKITTIHVQSNFLPCLIMKEMMMILLTTVYVDIYLAVTRQAAQNPTRRVLKIGYHHDYCPVQT